MKVLVCTLAVALVIQIHANCLGKAAGRQLNDLFPRYPHRRPRCTSWLLDLAWPSLTTGQTCGHLGSQATEGRHSHSFSSLSKYDFQIKQILFLKYYPSVCNFPPYSKEILFVSEERTGFACHFPTFFLERTRILLILFSAPALTVGEADIYRAPTLNSPSLFTNTVVFWYHPFFTKSLFTRRILTHF